MKKASAKAELYETDADGGDEKLLAAKNVTAAVEGLLGFKADQFRQVVLLPQGDFENSSWPTPASVSRSCRPYFIPSPMPNFSLGQRTP